jgi:hypothetical protein
MNVKVLKKGVGRVLVKLCYSFPRNNDHAPWSWLVTLHSSFGGGVYQ